MIMIKKFLRKIIKRKSDYPLRNRLGSVGEHTSIPDDLITTGNRNIYLGDYVSIGPRCLFYASLAPLTIHDHVMLGPEVMIITGDHRFDVRNKYMDEITNEMKLPENDKPVTIEDDCWVGARVLILKGVTIGKGSVIAAGATVLKDVPPNTIFYSKNKQRSRFGNR